MKKIAFCIVLTTLVLLLAAQASAQSKMSVGAGLDLMMPVGSFADNWGTGFGFTAEFDYVLSPHSSVTGKLGYLSWSEKGLSSGASASFGGVPILVGLKYYSRLNADGPVRFYGHLELGMITGSLSGSGHYVAVSESMTGFTIVPSLGAEIPAGPNGAVDVSIRYFDMARRGNFGIRAGYKLAI